jgi:hypothetical protein
MRLFAVPRPKRNMTTMRSVAKDNRKYKANSKYKTIQKTRYKKTKDNVRQKQAQSEYNHDACK